jgi:putative endonuclease
MVNYCYILANACNQTYNGYTNNLSRRVRQHNSEIKGGARYTCGKGPWEYIAVITCDDEAFTMRRALSLEWSIKYPTNKRPRPREYQGASGRINSLSLVFSNPKFADLRFVVYVHDAHELATATATVVTRPLSELLGAV